MTRTKKLITPYFEDGEFAGVRVTLGDEDFVIAPKDYREGDAMSWPEAMDALKEDGLSTFNYRQICFTMAYRKEVDKVLKDNGGDGLDNRYWTCAECMVYNSFIYNGGNSCLYIYSKNCTCSVRPIKNLKKNNYE